MAEADDLFQALVDVRNKATKYDILILCNGARKDVYPSSMSKSTGGGIIAYKLTKGKQARRADVVNIFDPADKNLIASPKEQSVFYEEWIKSLGQ